MCENKKTTESDEIVDKPKLYGEVIIDDSSYDMLYQQIREHVICDIKKDKYDINELEEIMSSVNFCEYVTIIQNSIDDVNIPEITAGLRSDQRTKLKIIRSIKNILDIFE